MIMKMQSGRITALILALSALLSACNSDEGKTLKAQAPGATPATASPSPSPNWTSVKYTKGTEPSGTASAQSCAYPHELTISVDGKYQTAPCRKEQGDVLRGQLSDAERVSLRHAADQVIGADPSFAPDCDPARASAPSSVVLSLPGDSVFNAFQSGPDQSTCYSGGKTNVLSLIQVLESLDAKYYRPASAGTICTQVFAYGLQIRVTNAAGLPLSGATVTIRDGSYSETLQAQMGTPGGIYQGAGERAGTYQVQVSMPGYVSQSLSVTVNRDECHVIPQERTVALVKQGN